MVMMWEKLKPSCRSRYVALVTTAKRPETRERRIQSVLRMTADYYRRHHEGRHQKT
ncbi:MAG: YdeI/OmpD-associated family protein [Chloroflexi bacterium]|nr:YdeI/OmpD-associated family protein [Chloroflexota bacterium]